MDKAPAYGASEFVSLSRSPYRLTVRTLSLHGRDWSSILHMDNLYKF